MTKEERSDDQPQQRTRHRWRLNLDGVKTEWPGSGGLSLAGSGLAGGVVVVLGWWFFQQPQSQITVPDMAGMSRITAEAVLKDEGLRLRATYDEVSDRPTGMVLQSHPAAGSKVDRGAGVGLVVAFPRQEPRISSVDTPIAEQPAPIPVPIPAPAPAKPVPAPKPAPLPKPAPAPVPKPLPTPQPWTPPSEPKYYPDYHEDHDNHHYNEHPKRHSDEDHPYQSGTERTEKGGRNNGGYGNNGSNNNRSNNNGSSNGGYGNGS